MKTPAGMESHQTDRIQGIQRNSDQRGTRLREDVDDERCRRRDLLHWHGAGELAGVVQAQVVDVGQDLEGVGAQGAADVVELQIPGVAFFGGGSQRKQAAVHSCSLRAASACISAIVVQRVLNSGVRLSGKGGPAAPGLYR